MSASELNIGLTVFVAVAPLFFLPQNVSFVFPKSHRDFRCIHSPREKKYRRSGSKERGDVCKRQFTGCCLFSHEPESSTQLIRRRAHTVNRPPHPRNPQAYDEMVSFFCSRTLPMCVGHPGYDFQRSWTTRRAGWR